MIEVLEKLKITYITNTNGNLEFNHLGIALRYQSDTKKIYVDDRYFGEIPHIMKDGSVCTAGNANIYFSDLTDEIRFENTIKVYIPWLFSIGPELRTAEFIGELDYFLRNIHGFSVERHNLSPSRIIKLFVGSPGDLWETLYYMNVGQTYKILVEDEPFASVIVKKVGPRSLVVDYQEYIKACQRVSGLDFVENERKIGFIGLGSVNSFIMKNEISKGTKKFVLVDKQKIEKGNLLRYAFPYRYMYKVIAGRKFALDVGLQDNDIQVYKFNVDKNTRNYFKDTDRVYISVDSFTSWFVILEYLVKHKIFIDREIVFVGIDAFGRFGKLIRIKTNITNDFNKRFFDFMLHDNGKTRKAVVPNGCGKSLAVYNEKNLISLSEAAISCSDENIVKEVDFNV